MTEPKYDPDVNNEMAKDFDLSSQRVDIMLWMTGKQNPSAKPMATRTP